MEKDQDRIPDHLLGPKKSYLGNITVEDLVWIGPDGEVDPDAILKQHGYDLNDPFTSVLSAIIRGNPVDGRDAVERLETALSALIGTRRKRGMDELDRDDELLIEIARKFFQAFHRDSHREPDLAPIIREVIVTLPEGDTRTLATENSIIRRLKRKFIAKRDVLLVQVTSEQNFQRMDVRRSIATILRELKALGVSAA